MADLKCKNIGFIGVGAMGRPMVGHLAAKLPTEIQIHIFDVSAEAMNEVCAENPGRVLKAENLRDVAQKSVCV